MVLSLAGFGNGLSAPFRALRARRLLRRGSLVVLILDGPVVELADRRPWWRRMPSRATSLASVREIVRLVAADAKVKGLVVEIRSIQAGAATATSLRQALLRLKESGKPLLAYLPMGGGSREMLVASAADKIVIGPASSIAPLGVAVETRYFRRVLDRIGVLPEIFARGEFKTAGESWARDSMSAEQREQLGAILDVMEGELMDALGKGRRRSPEDVRALVDGGPYRAPDAVAKHLVDAAAYDDDLPKSFASEDGERATMVPAKSYLAVRRSPPRRQGIGVVKLRGPIVSRAPLALGRMAESEQVIGALRAAGEAKAVRGVVLLIDSPGGSVLASDRIYHEVARLAEKKPVVAYFVNVAASGGYYVAAGAHAIVAQPTTITGSIGVVAAHLVLSPLLDKLGIVTELVKRGARADMLSPSRPLDPGERDAMSREIEGYYRDFVDIVARGRSRAPEDIEKLARGRVYSGAEAYRLGLVDRLGDFETALDVVRERLGETEPLAPAVIKPPRTMPKPPELPTPFIAALDRAGLGGARALATLGLSLGPAERVLAWSELAGLW
ncbi:MAG TPA: signal peptide peptidase SppA [Polyangiaceae bacterium]|nr:signal peptide peptidase SppA [Polyangiaceae bacterium]